MDASSKANNGSNTPSTSSYQHQHQQNSPQKLRKRHGTTNNMGGRRQQQQQQQQQQQSLTSSKKNNSNTGHAGSEDPLMTMTTPAAAAVVAMRPKQRVRGLDEFLETAYATGSAVHWNFWWIMLSLAVANSSDASEILCMSYILSDPSFDESILHGDKWRGGLLASAVFFGMLAGGLCVGTLGDHLGRRPMLLLGLSCNAVAGVISGMAGSVWTLSLLRCIAGVGIGATVPPLFTLATELAPPTKRGLCVTVCASFWMVGSIYVALAALGIFQYWSGGTWRWFAVACAVPSAAGGILVHSVVPESPRFLALQGKTEESLQVANDLSRRMNYRGPPLTIEELVHHFPPNASATSGLDDRHRRNAGVCGTILFAMTEFYKSAAKLYTPGLQRITWPLQLVWFSLSFGSYGLLVWINRLFQAVHLENVYANALLFALSNLPGNLISAYGVDRVGRNAMLVVSIVLAAASLVAFSGFAAASSLHAWGIVSSACAFQMFTIAAWNTIDVMTSELFPTSVRSTGMGICAASGRVGAMVAQFVNGELESNPVKLLLVASITLLLGAMTPCLLPKASDMTGQAVQDDILTETERRELRRRSSGFHATSPFQDDNDDDVYLPVESDSDEGASSSYHDHPPVV